MSQVAPRLVVTRFGAAATAALKQLVDAAKTGDLLAPIDVIVPSGVASVTVRRTLADPGLINVRFSSLPQLAERLAARYMALRDITASTATERSLAVSAAIRTTSGGRLAEAGAHPSTARLIEAVLTEMDDAEVGCDDRLDRLAQTSSRGAEVADLYRAYRKRLANRLTPTELLDAAADAVATGDAPDSHVVLFAPRRLSMAERRLLDTLHQAGRLAAVVAVTGDDEADSEALEIADWLGQRLARADSGAEPAEPAVTLSLPPDPEEEVRLAVRRTLQFFADAESTGGKRPERVAIAYRTSVPYARLLDEQLTGAGLPFHVTSQRSLAESVAGHALLHLLDLRTEDYARAELLDWLTDAPILSAVGHAVPVARWDRLSREAGISRSRQQWRDRLDRHAQGIADRRAELVDADAKREHYDRLIADCQELAAFVDDVVAACDRVAAATTWADASAALRDAVTRFLGSAKDVDRWGRETDATRWLRVEQNAYDGVLTSVAALAALDGPDAAPPTYDLVRQAVASELDRHLPSGTTLGRGVTVCSLRDVAGADLDLLIVLGMTESAFPPPLREHPILRDAERQAVGGLRTLADRRRAERRDYLAAVASARSVVLSSPRADTRAQRALHPSPWWLAAAQELHGSPLTMAQVAGLDVPWLDRHDSFVSSLLRASVPASSHEYDVRLALSGHGDQLAEVDARYARGRTAVTARRDGTFGPWTGRVDPLSDALRTAVDGRLSATSLQAWATCPLSFFFKRVLDVRDLESPDELDTVEALAKGSLVHAVLERFFREAVDSETPRSADAPWTPQELRRAHELLDQAADELEVSGRTGRPLLWRAERARLHRRLTRILGLDNVLRAQRGAHPIALEDAFGTGEEPPLELQLERSGPVELRGSIDRVDRTSTGGLVVIDYKTGTDTGYERIRREGTDPADGDIVDRGRKLQLVLYGLAARQRHGDPDTPVEAYYWFVEKGSLHRGAAIDIDAERRLLEVVDISVQGIRNGVYPARPGAEAHPKGWESCKFCAYDRMCSAGRGEQWHRLRDDDAVAEYAEMADPSTPQPEADA